MIDAPIDRIGSWARPTVLQQILGSALAESFETRPRLGGGLLVASLGLEGR